MKENITTAASTYIDAGLSVIPTKKDKTPACQWKQYMECPMDKEEADERFANAEGIGIVTGKASGNLELIDFDDGGSRFEPWIMKIPSELAERLVVETSPSGGFHVYCRVSDTPDHPFAVPRNRKLAAKPDGHVLIETRGEGGYVKCAPSEGYTVVQGDLREIPVISPADEMALIEAAQSLDESPSSAAGNASAAPGGRIAGASPARIRLRKSPWEYKILKKKSCNALVNAGWQLIGTETVESNKGGQMAKENWRRPGKNEGTLSATYMGGKFHVFSSNAAPFEADGNYSPEDILRLLGDPSGAQFRCASAAENAPAAANGDASAAENAPAAANGDASAAGNAPAAEGVSVTAGRGRRGRSSGPVDPGIIPEPLLDVPGFVNDLKEYTLATAPTPNPVLAFSGALAMLAHLSGRKYRDSSNLRTNLYILALAASDVGKERPRSVNKNLAKVLGPQHTLKETFASAEGLEDSLLFNPCSLYQVDEIDTLFANLASDRETNERKERSALLRFYTSSDTVFSMRTKAVHQNSRSARFLAARERGIDEPHLVLFGTGVPKYVFSALTERAMEDGLMSRCIVLEAGKRVCVPSVNDRDIPQEIVDCAKRISLGGGFTNLTPEPAVWTPEPVRRVQVVRDRDDEAIERRRDITLEIESLHDDASALAEKTLWTRAMEKIAKLAMLRAISRNPEQAEIAADDLDWGWRFVRHMTLRMLFQANAYIHDNEFHKQMQKVRRILSAEPHRTMPHSKLLRQMRIDADLLKKVINTLEESDELTTTLEGPKGAVRYTLNDEQD